MGCCLNNIAARAQPDPSQIGIKGETFSARSLPQSSDHRLFPRWVFGLPNPRSSTQFSLAYFAHRFAAAPAETKLRAIENFSLPFPRETRCRFIHLFPLPLFDAVNSLHPLWVSSCNRGNSAIPWDMEPSSTLKSSTFTARCTTRACHERLAQSHLRLKEFRP
jgi:hypothetical protein